jgi:uncharacterized membrane protein SpoIIM required for sporulation
VDIDRYLLLNQPGWDRLAELSGRARWRRSTLSAEEIDELVSLYQRTAAQLSHVRTTYRDPELIARLTALVAESSAAIYGQRSRPGRAFVRFYADTFPAAVWHLRRFIAVAVLATFLPALGMALWLTHDDAALARSGTPSERQAYVEDRFEQYYSDQPSLVFFTQVTTNNIRVSFTAFALGLFAMVPGVLILAVNGLALGQAAGWMIAAGDGGRFFGLILPHGLLELTSIVIAGGAGLALGWAWIAPGDRRRGDALAQEGRRAAAVVLGLMSTFLVAGTIEGFLTGSGLPAAVRVTVGACVFVAFVGYVVGRGRTAAARGVTGVMGESDVGRAPATGPAPVTAG